MSGGERDAPAVPAPPAAPSAHDDDELLIERLAEHLHRTMERLDPGGSEWATLSSYRREFYKVCVEEVLRAAQRSDAGSG